MIWDFGDGAKYESAYGVDDFDCESTQDIVQAIKSEIKDVNVLPRDPVSDFERMHKQAADELEGTERAKSAFLASSLRRVEKMGKGALLSVLRGDVEFRLVVTRQVVSVLKPIGTEDETPAALAAKVSTVLGGTARKLVY